MKKLILFLLAITTSILNFSQDFIFKSYVDQNNISSDESIRFIIESNERIQVNNLQFKDFFVQQGPFTSQSSQTTIINGKIESKNEFKSTFILIPKKEGNLIIDAVTVNYKGKKYSTQNINISVSNGKNRVTNKNSTTQRSKSDSKLFAKITCSKSSPFIGENILVQYKIYQSIYHVRNIEITDYNLPMSNDFWTELIEPKNKQWKEKREVINGIQYSVFILKKEIISAQKSGKIIIPAFEVSTLVNRDLFNRGIEKKLKSNKITLNVKDLPAGAPKDFKGQVGNNYKLNVSISKNELKVDEALDISIEISGNGNLKQLNLPKVEYPQDFEQFPEETKSRININVNGISGKKQLSQLLIPRFHGSFEIPKISFSYFDTYSKKYKTLSHPSSIIQVQKNNNSNLSSTTNIKKPNQEEVSVINENIHHIKSETKLNDFSSPLFGTFKYWSIIGAIPMILFLLLFILDNREKFTDKEKALMKKVVKEVNKSFNTAKIHLENNENDAFYSEIYKLWTYYISNKFNLQISALNKDKIDQKLMLIGVDQNDIKALQEILNYCEMSQYSPLSSQSAESSYNQSKLLFKNFEQNV